MPKGIPEQSGRYLYNEPLLPKRVRLTKVSERREIRWTMILILFRRHDSRKSKRKTTVIYTVLPEYLPMVKENTHLFAADRIYRTLADEVRAVIDENRGAYDLGSVILDSFYYHPQASVHKASDLLHGKCGESTSAVILEILGDIKHTDRTKDLAFVLGYITHCALDAAFHPVIYYLTGNHRDGSVSKDGSRYLHYHYETYLDHKWNSSFYLHRAISTRSLSGLAFPAVLARSAGIEESNVKESLEVQIMFNRLYRLSFPYAALLALGRMNLLGRAPRSLFYRNLRHDDRCLDGTIDYRDIISGEPLSATPEEILERAVASAGTMIGAAFDFYTGRSSEADLRAAIPGTSLATGKVGVSASDIVYTRFHSP